MNDLDAATRAGLLAPYLHGIDQGGASGELVAGIVASLARYLLETGYSTAHQDAELRAS